MDTDVSSILGIFETKRILEVPLFQRQYVWDEEKHWAPLWDDIRRKFVDYFTGDKKAPAHFLGAMVLDQKLTPVNYVERRLIIDGQQRLTTFQVFLAALRDFCAANGLEALSSECASFLLNTGMMKNPAVEKYKVQPTQKDRQQFQDIINAQSRAALEKIYPLVRRKRARKPEPRPRMVEAYLYFYKQLESFFLGSADEPADAGDMPLADRMTECILALKTGLKMVVIDLGDDDDAQVIFETLNARGEPLLPADLLRNNIFLRASRNEEDPDKLHDVYWKDFDDEFWRENVRQGRLLRPRSDLYLQHLLGSQLNKEIPINHLFIEYRRWIKSDPPPFKTVEAELAHIQRQGKAFRRIMAPGKSDVLHPLSQFLNAFEIGTAHPLLLTLLESDAPDQELKQIGRIIESYVMRRAVCRMTNKNYNRTFLAAAKRVRELGAKADVLQTFLAELEGESLVWPNDRVFTAALASDDIYNGLAGRRCAFLLRRLNDALYTKKMDVVSIDTDLTVEHLMPQDWTKHWLLPNGEQGLDSVSLERLFDDGTEKERVEASEQRDKIIQTLGNLTLMTQPLNSAISNLSWEKKRDEVIRNSMLPISVDLRTVEVWNEESIRGRSKRLIADAIAIWPAPPHSQA